MKTEHSSSEKQLSTGEVASEYIRANTSTKKQDSTTTTTDTMIQGRGGILGLIRSTSQKYKRIDKLG